MGQKAPITINLNELVKYLMLLGTLVGSVVTFGNQFWVRKEEFQETKTKVEVMASQIDFIHEAFKEAAKGHTGP